LSSEKTALIHKTRPEVVEIYKTDQDKCEASKVSRVQTQSQYRREFCLEKTVLKPERLRMEK
jgi:hypothetical protein